MIYAPRPIRNLLLLMAGLLLCVPGAMAGWETVRHNGHDYVTVRSIRAFYGFKTMLIKGSQIELENDVVKMRLTIGGQEVFMNNVKFVFSFKILPHQGRYLVSRIDLSKLVDPVLRPSYIPTSTPFNTVIIDPGHGGHDSGAVNRYGLEKNYNLAVARKLKRDLEALRFKVIMTRDSDRFLSLTERVKFANRFRNAIFISIHFNSGGRGRALGIETFTLSPAGVAHYGRGLRTGDFQQRTGNAHDSANIALATAVHGTCLLKTGRPDR
nr:N-acetylmuramoyl-L-alanine amidase [Akkermansiaceae bacterium]